jgi:single-strand DNA-binding protein
MVPDIERSEMNEVITITGNIATEPQHRHAAGVSITSFRVASNQRRFDRPSGQWIDTGTSYFSVSTFRSLADHAFQSLRKGDRVVLTGRLKVRDWESGDKKGTSVDVEAEAIGHDLRFGTSTFAKDAPEATRQGDSWEAPRAPGDEWSTPGVTDAGVADAVAQTEWPVASVPTEEPRPLELAGVEAPF